MSTPPSSSSPPVSPPLQLELRYQPSGQEQEPDGDVPVLHLPMSAQERTSLRGRRRTSCGRELLLHLPRGPALEPGERLMPADRSLVVVVVPAPEPVLVVRSPDPLTLLQAAYHLGNRHVSLEVRSGELRLLEDGVLEELMRQRGLLIEHRLAPFLPEPGAYAAASHAHSHIHNHDSDQPR
ncbi:urease accessory protein UreE [Synechococcus sp. BA-124 BA4]|nr:MULTISPECIES: urease accessory protein UreE [unclassified Synechococcus]MEA5400084.1 urease accessory protein UreE [Synechococcus sp. BA-124 BA4]